MPDFSCDFYRRIFAKEREFYAAVSVMFLHNGSDLAETLHGESNGVGGICKSKEMIVGIVCYVEVLKLNRGDCLTDNVRWVHTKLSKYTSSILEAYFRCEQV